MNRMSPIFMALSLIGLRVPFAQDFRQELSLNGPWQKLVTSDARLTPPTEGWQTGQVPSVSRSAARGETKYVWYRRDITIPAEWRGKRVVLHLGGARYHPHVFVDGEMIAQQLEGWTPFDVEITQQTAPGQTCRLHVRCQDWSATFTEGFRLPAKAKGDPRDAA